MASSLVVSLLAQRPTAELESARDEARGEIARLQVELQQVEEALGRQARGKSHRPRSTMSRQPAKPGSTRKRILDFMSGQERPASPIQIRTAINEQGAGLKGASIYNAIGRLVESGDLRKVADGQYQLASRNGSTGESHTGPSENGTGEPPFTATRSQEAEYE